MNGIAPGAVTPDEQGNPQPYKSAPLGQQTIAHCCVGRAAMFLACEDGSLGPGSLFYTLPTTPPGPPDGMTVDRDGRLYCTGPGGVWVFTPEGQHLGSILLTEPPANCTWGDADAQSLYITAQTSLFRVRCTSGGRA